MISKILVPSDGSKTAKKAAAYAVDLAKQLKASIIILSVIDQRSLIAQTVPASETTMNTIEPIDDYLKEIKKFKFEEKKKSLMSKIKELEGKGIIDESMKYAKELIDLQKEIGDL